MHRNRLAFVLATAIIAASPAATAVAQGTTVAPSAAPSPASVPEAWSPKPIGAYSLALSMGDHDMAVDLTISDSTGTLQALFWPVGDNDGHQMNVEVKGTDLVLTADSPRGPVRVVLQRSGDRLSGTWALGEDHGSLTGVVKPKS